MKVYTQGYQGKTIDDFIHHLVEHRVDVVLDVRYTPRSRKPGFSKGALREALMNDAGIEYRHIRALGNLKSNRIRAKTVEECLALYEGQMAPRWFEILQPLVKDYRGMSVCLVCFERDHRECHRSVVSGRLAVDYGCEVVHIGSGGE